VKLNKPKEYMMRKLVGYSLLMAALLFIAGPLCAGDTAILDIKPPSSRLDLPDRGPDLHYGQFDGAGVVHRITSQEVVIDDELYRLGSGMTYKYRDGSLATADNFPVGTRVWFVLYAENTIKSLWKEGR
jgi:hypothetical protein